MRLVLVTVLILGACKGGEDEDAFDFSQLSDDPLEGVIGGEAWSFDSAITDGFLSDEDGFFTIFAAEPTGCDSFGGVGNELITSLPTAPGEVTLSLSDSVTFYVASTGENLVAVDGGIRVDAVGDDLIEGALYAMFDEDNEVNGTFTVSVCPAVDF